MAHNRASIILVAVFLVVISGAAFLIQWTGNYFECAVDAKTLTIRRVTALGEAVKVLGSYPLTTPVAQPLRVTSQTKKKDYPPGIRYEFSDLTLPPGHWIFVADGRRFRVYADEVVVESEDAAKTFP